MRLAPGLLLLALLLTPLALADHAYSHRYVLVGRVVDAQGAPVGEARVHVDVGNFSFEGPCSQQPGSAFGAFGPTRTNLVTNARGEFMACLHAHAIPVERAPTITLRLEDAENTTVQITMDARTRADFVLLASPSLRGTPRTDEYTVAGRVWNATENVTMLEGAPVYGLTHAFVPVNVTLEHDGVVERVQATTNLYGDFAVRLNVTKPVTDGTVLVEVLNATHRVPASSAGISYVRTATQTVETTPSAAPVETPALPLAGVLAALAVALALRQRRGGA